MCIYIYVYIGLRGPGGTGGNRGPGGSGGPGAGGGPRIRPENRSTAVQQTGQNPSRSILRSKAVFQTFGAGSRQEISRRIRIVVPFVL